MSNRSIIRWHPRAVMMSFAAATLLYSSTASLAAVTDTWDFRSGAVGKYNPNNLHPAREYTSNAGMQATVTGWYANGQASIGNANGAIRHWDSGMGLYRTDQHDGEHSVDNVGHDEFLIFQFDEAVSLQNVSFGWIEHDADITVLYKGDETDSGTGSLEGSQLSGLTSNGYSLLGDFSYTGGSYGGGSTGTRTTDVSSSSSPAPETTIYSKVWLVGAYLGNIFTGSSHFSDNNDRFKLATLTTVRQDHPPGGQVSAPMTAILMAMGLLPLVRRARR